MARLLKADTEAATLMGLQLESFIFTLDISRYEPHTTTLITLLRDIEPLSCIYYYAATIFV